LFQYLGLESSSRSIFRWVTIGIACIVAIWGTTFFFLNLFTCVPVSGFWRLETPARCILIKTWDEAQIRYVGFAASNTVLNVVIFILPLFKLRSTDLARKNLIGLIGLSVMGFM